MAMRMDRQGKRALVTGAAHRIGRAIALGLAEAGYDLVVHYHRSKDAAEKTLAEARKAGVQATCFGSDLTSMAGLQALFQHVDQHGDGLDILVNSAATLDALDLMSVDSEDWQRVVGLNLRGAFFCLQAAARRMDRGGCIVNISDTAAVRPWIRYPLHSISKAGLEMLTKIAALSLAPQIRVNALMPGPVMKPSGMRGARWSEVTEAVPLARAATGTEVAQATLFLIEHEYITGETLTMDGGSLLT